MIGRPVDQDDLAGGTVEDFLDRLAARVPVPGGGATAALHAAQAAALLGMVARYTTGERFAEHRAVVDTVIAAADEQRAACLRLVAADAAAFTSVTEAYRLPRQTPEEVARRREAVDRALVGAAGPPSDVIRASGALLSLAAALLPVANRMVLSDVAAATEAARVAATTARLNVEINLAGVEDQAARGSLAEVLTQVDDVVRRAAQIERTVRDRIRG